MTENDLFEKALARVKNRFLLCMLIAKRLAQLKKGSAPLIEEAGENLEETALREIIAGKLEYEIRRHVSAVSRPSEEFEGEFQGGTTEEE
ncbi:MAG: DNA-directed RNA polymerase subunit omega [Nitrospinota bacterium]